MPGKPKPFSRPSIDLGGVKREWVTIEAQYIAKGDTVPDYGVVESWKHLQYQDFSGPLGDGHGEARIVRLTFVSGKRLELPYDQMTFVFH